MKKLVCVMVVCILLLPILSIAEAQKPQQVATFILPNEETVRQCCTDGEGGFYVLATQSIFHWMDGEQTAPIVIFARLEDESQITGICCYQGVLYGVSCDHQAAYYNGNAWVSIGKNADAPNDVFSCRITATDEKLFYTYKEDSDRPNQPAILHLCSFDLSTGEVREWPAFDGIEMDADEEEKCVYHISQSDGGTLCTLKTEDGTITEVSIAGMERGFLSSYYEPVTHTFFMTTREGVYRWRGQGDAELFWPDKSVRRLIPFSDDRIAVVDTSSITVYSFQHDAHEAREITVMGFQSVHQKKFTQLTGISVEKQDQVYASMVDEVTHRLINHDSSVDIFAVWSDEGFALMKQKGYYTDLSPSSILSGAADELFPAFQAAVKTTDGQLAAWPFFVYTHLMSEDQKMLASYDFRVPTTFDELLDLIPEVWASELLQDNGYVMFDTISCCRSDLFRVFVRQFIRDAQMKGEVPTFNDERFLRIAKRILVELPVEDPVPHSEDGEEVSLMMLDCVREPLIKSSYIITKDKSDHENSILRARLREICS